MVDYKRVYCLQPGEYAQVLKEYEPCIMIDINRNVQAIVLLPQYNLQGGYLFKTVLTGKLLPGHIGPLLI